MHVPATAPPPVLFEKPPLDLDAVLDDAEMREDRSEQLSDDLEAWRRALIDLLDECRTELTEVNEQRGRLVPGKQYGRRRELSEQREALTARQSLLETRLRYVKTLLAGQRPGVDRGTALEQARAHLYAALDLLNEIKNGTEG